MKENEVDLNDPFLVIYKGEPKYFLSKSLAIAKGIAKIDADRLVVIDEKRLDKLRNLHVSKLNLFESMETIDDSTILKSYAELVTLVEYELQENWGFEKDANFHEWFLVPKCVCPKMDGRERLGTKYQIIRMDCPIHGE